MDGLSRVLEDIRGKLARPVMVGIEGQSGSGKSFLAAQLSEALSCPVIHGDDFYRVMGEEERMALTPEQGYALYFDRQRLRTEVLIPVKAGRAVQFQRYNWKDSCGLDGWVNVAPAPVVIVEGVYMGRPQLRPFFDVLIYVNTPEVERRQRLQARTWDDPAWVARWDAAEQWYRNHHAPERQVHFVISGLS